MDNNPNLNTLIVNLFAGPGAGKSTTAGGLFYKLKTSNINCEYIQEYAKDKAKDKAWQGDMFTLECQPYITGKQLYRLHRVLGKCEVIITDSPLLQGLVYGGKFVDESFKRWVASTHNSMNTLDIFLERDTEVHPYEEAGRSQSLDEAITLDAKIYKLLEDNQDLKKPIYRVVVDNGNYINTIESLVKSRLN